MTISTKTLGAKTLAERHAEAKMAPAIVTDRQPYLLTKEDEIGPFYMTKQNQNEILC